MKKKIALLILIFTFPYSLVYAEYLGLPYGNSANVADQGNLAVEGGIQLGDLDNFIARASLKMSDQLSVYGDLGFTDVDSNVRGYDSDSGLNFGAGAVLSLGPLAEGMEFGVLGSLHLATTDDFDWTGFAVRGIASGQLAVENLEAQWYGSAGIEFLSVSVDGCGRCDADDTELAFGGGIIYPIGPGEAFGGIDYVDDFTLGGGYRINLN